MLETRIDRRVNLLARNDLFPPLDQYIDSALQQADVRMPVLTGRPGIGRTAMLQELGERQSVVGRSVGFGAVRTGLGQALQDVMTSLCESVGTRRPGAPSLGRLMAAADAFRGRFPDEANESDYSLALDHLLYSLSEEVGNIPGGYVVLLDDLHLANERRSEILLEGLHALATTGAPIPTVLSSKSVGRRPLGLDEVPLRPINNADVADLAQRFGLTVKPEVIRMVGEFADGRPGRAVAIMRQASEQSRSDEGSIRLLIDAVLEDERARAMQEERAANPYATQVAPVAEIASPAADRTLSRPIAPTPPTSNRPVAPNPDTGSDRVVNGGIGVEPEGERPIRPGLPTREARATVVTAAPPVAVRRLPDAVKAVEPSDPTVEGWPSTRDLQPREAQRPVALPTLNPQQWRVLDRAQTLLDEGHLLTLKLLQRVLGEVARFGGAASPVADAVNDLTRFGVFTTAGPNLEISPTGSRLLANRPAS
jgi:hypothetical protein